MFFGVDAGLHDDEAAPRPYQNIIRHQPLVGMSRRLILPGAKTLELGKNQQETADGDGGLELKAYTGVVEIGLR